MDEFKHYLQIDILKGLAIISVVILHTIPVAMIKLPFPVFSIYQAVPVFLVLMAVTAVLSFKRRGYNHMLYIYPEYLKNRFKRLLYPLIMVWIISLVLGILLNKEIYIGIFTIMGYLPLTGQGDYFISVLLQFTLLFPILYKLYNYNSKYFLIICFALNLIFEVYLAHTSILRGNTYWYKASIFRYLFLIALGMWLVDNFHSSDIKSFIKKKFVLTGLGVSILYMVGLSAFSWYFPYIQGSWQPQIILSFFYPLVLCAVGITYLPSAKKGLWNILSVIGKASYHIFLIQIIFFGAGFSITSIIASSGLQSVYNNYMLGIIALTGNITITLILGLLFYYIEPKLVKKVEIQSLKLNKALYRLIPKIYG